MTSADTTNVSSHGETTLDDWRKALAVVLDALRAFPEARKAANEAILRMPPNGEPAHDRQSPAPKLSASPAGSA